MVNEKGFEMKEESSYNKGTSVGEQGSKKLEGQSVAGVAKAGLEPKSMGSVPVEQMLVQPSIDPYSKKQP